MLITFTSVSKAHQKDNKVSFTSPVTLSEWNGFKVYEFVEPSMGEHNRIEVSNTVVNIMAGRNTLNLSLGEKIQNEYLIPGAQSVMLATQLHDVEMEENLIKFSYSLFNNGEEISVFDLTLEIKEK